MGLTWLQDPHPHPTLQQLLGEATLASLSRHSLAPPLFSWASVPQVRQSFHTLHVDPIPGSPQ